MHNQIKCIIFVVYKVKEILTIKIKIMKTTEAKKRIEFFTNIFLSVISKAIKENIDGIEAGRIALKIVGCPEDVALEIERLTIIQLNKN